MLSAAQRRMLHNLAIRRDGRGPDGPYINEDGQALMRSGLVELVKPPCPWLPYAQITAAGRKALESENG